MQQIFFRNNLIFFSLLIITSVMYVIYFFGYDANEASLAPFILRFIPKLIGLGFFYFACFRFFSLQAFFYNFGLKIPILFISFVTFLTIPYQDSAELQSVNMLLFLPLLALDWSKDKDYLLFRTIFMSLTIIFILQAFSDPFLKFNSGVGFENWGLVGGVGNSNSFSLFLLTLALFAIIVLKKTLLFYFLCFATFFTGSLTGMVISASILGLYAIKFILRFNLSSILLFLFLVPLIYQFINYLFLLEELPVYRSFTHSYDKFIDLINVIFFQAETYNASGSISIRAEYNQTAINLLKDNPLSLIWGHPDSLAIYTGDGWWTALLVTHGLILVILFIIVNIYAVTIGIRRNLSYSLFASSALLVILTFFLSNRILDYWPSAFIYFMCFSFLINYNGQKL